MILELFSIMELELVSRGYALSSSGANHAVRSLFKLTKFFFFFLKTFLLSVDF